jgi:multidrug resistance protein, MATE family
MLRRIKAVLSAGGLFRRIFGRSANRKSYGAFCHAPEHALRPLNRRLWSIALPMMLANSSIALFGLVDAAVVGHLENETFLAGVALAGVLFDFLYWGVTFLRMGTTGVVAQAHGARDFVACRGALYESGLIALGLSLFMLLLNVPLMNLGLSLLGGSQQAHAQAEIYFQIKIWGAPAVLLTMVQMGWLIGMGEARSVLKLTAVASLLNVFLDLVFVLGFGLGVEGVAYASMLASYFAACWGVYLSVRVFKRLDIAVFEFNLDLRRLRRLLSLNTNILIRTICLIFAFALFTRSGAKQGDIILAANTLLLSFQMVLALALDGYANALEVLVGESIGAKNRRLFRDVISAGIRWSVMSAVVFSAGYFFCGPYFIALLTDIEGVRSAAGDYLAWLVLSPVIAVWCFVFDGIFIGATQGRAMRNSMLFALLGVYLPALWVFRELGNHGIWAAFMLFFAARGASMAWLFYRIKRQDGFMTSSSAA